MERPCNKTILFFHPTKYNGYLFFIFYIFSDNESNLVKNEELRYVFY